MVRFEVPERFLGLLDAGVHLLPECRTLGCLCVERSRACIRPADLLPHRVAVFTFIDELYLHAVDRLRELGFILRIVTDRLEMFLETSMLTDLNRNKVLTQPISFGLTCMTHSLMSHALDGFTFLMCVNSEFEVLPPTLTKTMRFIPVRV